MSPRTVKKLRDLEPLPGPPLPMPPPLGVSLLQRKIGPRNARGASIPLAVSGPLLTQFLEFYQEVCGTDHGWQLRLSGLLRCDHSRVTTWWATYQGKTKYPSAPSGRFVRKLQDLLANPDTLRTQVHPSVLREATQLRIEILRQLHEDRGGLPKHFVSWLMKGLSSTDHKGVADWAAGRSRAKGPSLKRLDALIALLNSAPPGPSVTPEP